MSYEHMMGMGWSELQDSPSCEEIPGYGTKRCFENTDSDRACAAESGCVQLRTRSACTTTNTRRPGQQYCCPPHRPNPLDLCPTPGGSVVPEYQAGAMRCDMIRTPRSEMVGDEARATWDVQEKLCTLGIDPGPIDGREHTTSYIEAIRSFQARNGLPQTGAPDRTTLYRMGFSQVEANRISGAVIPSGGGGGVALPWGAIIGSTLAASFLMVGAWMYVKRR